MNLLTEPDKTMNEPDKVNLFRLLMRIYGGQIECSALC